MEQAVIKYDFGRGGGGGRNLNFSAKYLIPHKGIILSLSIRKEATLVFGQLVTFRTD